MTIKAPGVGPMGQLADACVHLRDCARPLGLPDDVDLDDWRMLLDWLPPRVPGLVPRRRLAGLRLVATDQEWSWGEGPEVRGPSEAVAMAAVGRRSRWRTWAARVSTCCGPDCTRTAEIGVAVTGPVRAIRNTLGYGARMSALDEAAPTAPVQSVDRASRSSSCWRATARPASPRSPRGWASTSPRRSGCSSPWRRTGWSSRSTTAAATGSASATCGWPAPRPPASTWSPRRDRSAASSPWTPARP